MSPSPWLEPYVKRKKDKLSDRTPGLLFKEILLGLKYYADEPPSIWTSTSRCIQLYAHNTSRGATPMPLAEWVRLGLPGVLARIN